MPAPLTPGRLVSDDPSYKTWEQDSCRGDSVKAGVWEASPGENRSIEGETFESCHIVSGVVELTEEGKKPRIFPSSRSLSDRRVASSGASSTKTMLDCDGVTVRPSIPIMIQAAHEGFATSAVQRVCRQAASPSTEPGLDRARAACITQAVKNPNILRSPG
ncbi:MULTISPECIES: cupin domain-containing protein [unclassified Bradyrhizobium]